MRWDAERQQRNALMFGYTVQELNNKMIRTNETKRKKKTDRATPKQISAIWIYVENVHSWNDEWRENKKRIKTRKRARDNTRHILSKEYVVWSWSEHFKSYITCYKLHLNSLIKGGSCEQYTMNCKQASQHLNQIASSSFPFSTFLSVSLQLLYTFIDDVFKLNS